MEVWFWLIFLLVVIPYIIITYNQFVSLLAQVNGQRSNIQASLVRRANLYEKMASIMVEGTSFEQKLQKEITQIRENGSSDLANLERKGEQLQGMVARLESNPDIKTIGMLRDMQRDAEKTEDLIQVSKETYNALTANYNEYTRQFPSILVALLFMFRPLPFIHAD